MEELPTNTKIRFGIYLIKKGKIDEGKAILLPLITKIQSVDSSMIDSLYYFAGLAEITSGNLAEGDIFFNSIKDSTHILYHTKILFRNFLMLNDFKSLQSLPNVDSIKIYYQEIARLQNLADALLRKEPALFLTIFEKGKCTITTLNTIEFNLYLNYLDLIKIPDKKLWKAIILSAVVPGLGKLYLGKKREAISSFLPVLLNGIQSFEGYRKNGLKSPNFYVFGGIGFIFYLSNIHGTKKCLKRTINEYYEQINKNVLQQMSELSFSFNNQ
jgi:hypothetical protein